MKLCCVDQLLNLVIARYINKVTLSNSYCYVYSCKTLSLPASNLGQNLVLTFASVDKIPRCGHLNIWSGVPNFSAQKLTNKIEILS